MDGIKRVGAVGEESDEDENEGQEDENEEDGEGRGMETFSGNGGGGTGMTVAEAVGAGKEKKSSSNGVIGREESSEKPSEVGVLEGDKPMMAGGVVLETEMAERGTEDSGEVEDWIVGREGAVCVFMCKCEARAITGFKEEEEWEQIGSRMGNRKGC